MPFCHEHNNGRSLRTIFARHGEPHGSSALLICRNSIGNLNVYRRRIHHTKRPVAGGLFGNVALERGHTEIGQPSSQGRVTHDDHVPSLLVPAARRESGVVEHPIQNARLHLVISSELADRSARTHDFGQFHSDLLARLGHRLVPWAATDTGSHFLHVARRDS